MTHLQEPQPTNQPDYEPQTGAPEVSAEPALEWTLAEELIDRELEAAESDADRTYWEGMQGKLDSDNPEDWEEIYNLGVKENARIEEELDDDPRNEAHDPYDDWGDDDGYEDDDTEDPLEGDVDKWVHQDETRTDAQIERDERYAIEPY